MERAQSAGTKLSAEQSRRIEGMVDRVAVIAKALRFQMPQVTVDDLISAGHEGLVQAALRYDPTSDVPFRAFAHYRIRGAMIDCARRAVPAVRTRTRAQRAMEATLAVLEHAQAEQAALDAAATRTLQDRVAAAAEVIKAATTAILLSKLPPLDPDRSVDETAPSAEDQVLGRELETLLHDAIADCSPDDRALLQAVYFEGMSMHTLADQRGTHVSTISRRHARLMKRLGSRLGHRLGGPPRDR